MNRVRKKLQKLRGDFRYQLTFLRLRTVGTYSKFKLSLLYRTRPLRDLASRLSTTRLFLVLLLALGLFTVWNSYVDSRTPLWENILAEVLGLVITVIAIDYLYEQRSIKDLKEQLLIEIGSPDNGTAIRAAKLMEGRGWTHDGTLERKILNRANLKNLTLRTNAKLNGVGLSEGNLGNVYFHEADMRRIVANATEEGEGLDLSFSKLYGSLMTRSHLPYADFRFARLHRVQLQEAFLGGANFEGASCFRTNFKGAYIHPEQLVQCYALLQATMPNGIVYDGRFKLREDVNYLETQLVDPKDIEQIANAYGVTIDEYLSGQKWHEEHFKELLERAATYQQRYRSGEIQGSEFNQWINH